jgi:hypothetical protein
MDPNVSTLERAFELAASGRFNKVSDIRLQLHREGYNHEMVQGAALTKQLSEAMERAHRRASDATQRPDMAVDNARKGAARKGK